MYLVRVTICRGKELSHSFYAETNCCLEALTQVDKVCKELLGEPDIKYFHIGFLDFTIVIGNEPYGCVVMLDVPDCLPRMDLYKDNG